MILRLLYVSLAVENLDESVRAFRDIFGLKSQRMISDPFLGTDRGACIPFANDTGLYIMESHRPESPVYCFLAQRGPGLERLAFETDDLEAALERLRYAGCELAGDAIAYTPLGRRFEVPPEYAHGIRLEVIEPAPGTWDFLARQHDSGVLGLQHIGIVAERLEESCARLQQLLDLPARDLRSNQHGGQQKDIILMPGNDRLWLHIVESWEADSRVVKYREEKGEGLEHICIEVDDIRQAVIRALDAGALFTNHKIHTDRPDGFEAFIPPEYTKGTTVELIEPFPTSRGYRVRRASSARLR